MKKKKIVAIGLTLSLVLTGCSGMKSTVKEAVKKESVVASAMTVKDIKKKYGTEDTKGIMPMYNVERDKEFTFTFPFKIRDILPSDMISVHTDIKAQPESKLLTFVNEDYAIGGTETKITVKPGMAVLPSDSDFDTSGGSWGNAPIYYIRINYDLESKTPQKLDTPIVIPFTIKSELPVPNLRKEISPDGRLKLVWDKVKGAEQYKVYQVSHLTLLKTENEPLSGAETGFKGNPLLQTTTTETELSDFIDMGKDSLNEYKGIVTGQNYGVNGDYYVTAIAGDKESNFSVPVSTASLSSQLPLDMEDDLSLANYEHVKDLPKTAKVKFIDGSIQDREVIYDMDKAEVSESGHGQIYFSIKGTAFKSYVNVENMKEEDKAVIPETHDSNTGFVEPKNETDNVPKPSVPTIIEKNKDNRKPATSSEKQQPKKDESKKEEKTGKTESSTQKEDSAQKPKEESTKEESQPSKETTTQESADDVVAQQQENTKDHVEEGNKEEVSVPEVVKDLEINAKSDLEEYLALKMIGAENDISLEAFPEAQNYSVIEDTFKKVIYQNSLILGVKSYMYDYSTLTLHVEYDDSKDVIKQKQEEIVKEAKKIVSSTIKSSMSDEQKRKALYDYLNDHTKYDDEALKNAEQNNYQSVDESFNDSFTTYGIMVEKVGVCQSYAMTYKMLLDLAGVESIVVTGTADGVPHAWNKVKIDNEWLHIDNTNNETNVGIPYMVYESNDATLQAMNFIANKEYWIDGEIGKFAGKTDKYDYYVANHLEVKDVNTLKTQLTKELKAGKTTIVIRLGVTIDDDTLMKALGEILSKVAPDKLNSTRYGVMGDKYLMIKTE